MKKQPFFLLAIFTLSTMLLASCAAAEIDIGNTELSDLHIYDDAAGTEDNIIYDDQITDNSNFFAEATHISQVLTDNVTIDAYIEFPITRLSSYRITRNSLKPENMLMVFNEDINHSTITYSEYDSSGFTVTTTSGAYINHEYITLRYTANQKFDEITDVMRNYAEKSISRNEVTFDAFSREDALQCAISVFDKLGVLGVPSAVHFIGLRHNEIIAYQEELMLDESYAHFVEIGKTILLDDLSASDDAYYLWFTFDIEGITIIDTSTAAQLEIAYFDVFMPSICAEILITSEGIKSFYMYGNYKENGISESKDALPFDEILNAITRKYEMQIVSEPMKFIRAELEYLFLPNINDLTSDVIMTPYWKMEYIVEDSRGSDFIFADRINAFTGEDFAYGG